MEETQTQLEQTPKLEEQLAILPAGLIADLLSYLGTKPHTEVNPYILAIQQNARLIKPNQIVKA